ASLSVPAQDSPAVEQPLSRSELPPVPDPMPARRSARARAKPAKPPRPKGKVPGGKALARIKMFLLQRGAAPEIEPPTARPARRPSAARLTVRSPALDVVTGF